MDERFHPKGSEIFQLVVPNCILITLNKGFHAKELIAVRRSEGSGIRDDRAGVSLRPRCAVRMISLASITGLKCAGRICSLISVDYLGRDAKRTCDTKALALPARLRGFGLKRPPGTSKLLITSSTFRAGHTVRNDRATHDLCRVTNSSRKLCPTVTKPAYLMAHLRRERCPRCFVAQDGRPK
jgi:hypothetical protein